jgi:hypothetical protein
MTGYYDILEKLRVSLEANPSVNTVTEGDLLEVDLSKQTIFPLSHIIVQNATFAERTITFNLNILFIDIVDFNKDDPKADIPFRGNNNEQDVLNTMLQVANKLWSDLSRGDLYTDKYQINGTPSAEPFVDRFDNQVAGWDLTLSISIPNSEISVCV